GDPIRMITVRGRILEGTIEKMTPDTVTIDKTSLLKTDSKMPLPLCFEPEQVATHRDHYMKLNFEIPRRDYAAERYKEILPGVLNEFGYIHFDNTWMRLDEYINRQLKPEID